MAELHGSVERIVFLNPESHFTVARLIPTGRRYRSRRDLVTLVGSLPGVRPGESLLLVGDWQNHPVHGRNFRVERFEVTVPTTVDGIMKYLASGLVKGIGEVRARQIVEHFGEHTLEVIENAPQRLADIKGIGPKQAEAIAGAWREQKGVKRVMQFLQELEVDSTEAAKIYRHFGEEAIEVIKTDPYRLEQDIDGVGFITADRVAQKVGVAADSPRRLASGVKHVLSQATEGGHVFLPKEDLAKRSAQLLGCRPEQVDGALVDLRLAKQIIIDPSAVDVTADSRIYLTPFFLAEHGVAHKLKTLLSTPTGLKSGVGGRGPGIRIWEHVEALDSLFADFEEQHRMKLAVKQVEAVHLATSSKLSVLTGGPGVGKTTTLRALIYALERQRVPYCLAAPTGRAAKRLTEVTGRNATTLHRLLDYAPHDGRFRYDDERPLPHAFVIVDEASMLDLLLANHLLKAIAREAQVLFVGDIDQLPSVGPGNFLRDIIESGRVPVVRLTELFRQAKTSEIVVNAHRINCGEDPILDNKAESDFFFLKEEVPDMVSELIVDLVERRLPRKFGFDPLRDIQVLAPIYGGMAGVSNLNATLQARLNPPEDDKPEVASYGRVFRQGDKVMQVRNNYDKSVFNGDIGQIKWVNRQEHKLVVDYPNERGVLRATYEFSELDEIALAYAISVHKAQGSEYPAVVMPVLTQHYPLLQRNLLYTAISRARRLCVLVGTPGALFVASRRNTVECRHTALAERLAMVVDKEIKEGQQLSLLGSRA